MPETFGPLTYDSKCLQCLQQAFLISSLTFTIVKCSQTVDFFFLLLVGCSVSMSISSNGMSKYSGCICMLTGGSLSIGVVSMRSWFELEFRNKFLFILIFWSF